MALTNRFSAIDKAIIVSTGNSLVTCGSSTALNTNTSDMITITGATTRDWTLSGSTSLLNIISNSTILYAELTWYSTVKSDASGAPDLQSVQDDTITFDTPSGSYQITPTFTQSLTTASGSIDRYRSSVVTEIISNSLSGNYTVSKVPTSIPPTGLSKTRSGWCLSVVYRNDAFSPRKIIYTSGIANATVGTPLQTIITGFTTSSSDTDLEGAVFFACANGQPLDGAESVQVGPSFASLVSQGNPVTTPNQNPGTAPNNPVNNFFSGQINVCNPLSSSNGLINVNGTNASNNSDAFVPIQVVGARNKWDLTNINISNSLVTNQNQLAIQVTEGNGIDGVMLVGIGTSVKAAAPNITTTFSAFDPDGRSANSIMVGEKLVYKLQIRNSGTVDATNVIISSPLSASTSFVPNSLTLNGTTVNGTNIVTGVNIGTVSAGAVENILFEVLVNSVPPTGGIQAYMNYNYSFVSGSGSPTTTNSGSTNVVTLTVLQALLTMTKTASSLTAEIGDTIEYNIVINNIGTETATALFFQDRISQYASFITGSVAVNGIVNPIFNPNTGFTLSDIPANGQATISFSITVTSLAPSKSIYNSTELTATFFSALTKTFFSNVVTISLQYTSIVGERCSDNDYPQVNDTVTYTLSLTNIGNIIATNVQVQEPPVFGATFIPGSVVIDGVSQPSLNPFIGFTIPSIAPQQTVDINYDVLINTVNPNRLVQNIANVPFQYQISASAPVVSSEIDSNTVKTLTSFVNVALVETVDKAYAVVGDTLYYSVSISNTGNIDAINTIFQSAIQAESTFVPNSVAINGVPQPGLSPITGFSIGTLCSSDTIVVTYQATVNSVPSGNIISNNSELTYSYLIDPNGSATTTTSTSNTVQTTITKLDFTFTKTVDKEYAVLGDYISYTMFITNTGNVLMQSVFFRDILTPYLTLGAGQVFINGVQFPNVDPSIGFPVGDIHPGDTVRVSLGCQIISLPPAGFVVNNGLIRYTYQLNPTSEVITQTASSNEVRTFIVDGNLAITKAVDKSYAVVGDTLTYSFNISNIGNVTTSNLSFIDIIPTGSAFISGSVKVNGITKPDYNPITGFPLVNLNAGQVATVSFNTTVTSIPTPNTLINNGSVTFNYLLQPNTPPVVKTVTSNTVTTTVNASTTTLTKAVDKAYATINDILNYTLVLSNTGTVQITNINFLDIIPNGATFEAGTVKINDVSYPDYNPNNGFIIPNVSPSGNATISFQAKVTSVPTPNTIINSGTVSYNYKLSPTGPTLNGNATSNTVTTIVNQFTATLTKSVNKIYATIGDELTYTSLFTNTGNIPLTNVIFSDIIPSETNFVTGSVKINGIDYPTYNPISTFPLPDVAPGASVTVVFKVTATTVPTSGYVENSSRVEFKYQINPTGPIFNGAINSNFVITYIRVGSLNITKAADKQVAILQSIVNYSFVITNTGNTTLVNQSFIDTIQPDSTFNNGSVVINGISQLTYNPNVGFILPDLPIGQEITIGFSVTVITVPIDFILKNTGTVSYSYYIDPQVAPISSSKTSNETTVTINNTIINPVKAVDKSIAKIGDEITYSFNISNLGNTPAFNVLFQDTLSTNLSFVNGSVIVNGTPQPTFNPNTGFSIPDINGGSANTISFKATIVSRPPGNIIYNFATLDYEYQPIPTEPPIAAEITTNTVQTLVAAGEISLVKSVNKVYSTLNDELTYTVVVTNTGSVNATNLSFIDLIPTGATFKASSVIVNGTAQPTFNPNTGFAIPNLIPNQSNTISFNVIVTSIPASGKLDNFASVTFSYQLTPLDPVVTTTTNSNTVTTFVNIGILNVTKAVDKAYATIGNVLNYSFTVTNSGTVPCSSITFLDQISSKATFNNGSVVINGTPQPSYNPNTGFPLNNIAPGVSTTVSFSVTVNPLPPSAIVEDNLILNFATVNYSYFINPADPTINTSANSNTVQTIINVGSLTLTKSVNKAYATIDDIIIYTVNVQNTGNVNASNVNFRDIIPTGLTFIPNSVTINGVEQPGFDPFASFTLGTITPGTSIVVSFRAAVTSVPNPSLIINTATATFSYRINPAGPDIITEVTSNAVTTQINIGQLTATKAVDKFYATVGDILTYSFEITNTGNVNATNVIFTDTLLAGISFNTGSVIVNGVSQLSYNPINSFSIGNISTLQTATVSFTVTVTSVPPQQTVLDYALIDFNYKIDPQGETLSKSVQSNTVITFIRLVTLTAVKSVNNAYATLQDQLTYTVVVKNTGNTLVFSLNFLDILSSGATFVTGSVTINGIPEPTFDPIIGFALPNLISGNTATVEFKATVTALPSPPVIQNYASVNGSWKVNPQGPDYPASTVSNTVSTNINVGNLTVVKAVDKQYAKVLDTLTYTNVITNTGNVNATNVTFLDNLQSEISFVVGTVRINGVVNPSLDPTIGINLGTLAPSQVTTVEFDVKINTLPTPPQVNNSSQVTFGYKIDPNGSTITTTKNSNTVTTNIVLGNLTAVKSVDKSIATINDILNYTIVLTNNGNTIANDVLFQDTPSIGATFNIGSVKVNGVTQPTYSPITGFSLGNIAIGAVVTVQFAVTVTSVPPTNVITNQATINFKYVVDPKDPPFTTTTTSNTVTTNVALGNLTVVKSVNKAYATIGDQLTYTIVITNIGNINATNVVFLDDTPANSAFVVGSVTVNGTPQPSYNPSIGFNLGTMTPGQIITVIYKVVVIS